MPILLVGDVLVRQVDEQALFPKLENRKGRFADFSELFMKKVILSKPTFLPDTLGPWKVLLCTLKPFCSLFNDQNIRRTIISHFAFLKLKKVFVLWNLVWKPMERKSGRPFLHIYFSDRIDDHNVILKLKCSIMLDDYFWTVSWTSFSAAFCSKCVFHITEADKGPFLVRDLHGHKILLSPMDPA